MINIGIFISLIVFFLPYAECFVLNIGYPFKIYELLGIILFFLLVLGILIGEQITIKITKYEKKIYLVLLVFSISYCISVVMGLYNLANLPEWAVGRYEPVASGATRILYLIFNILFFILFSQYIRNKTVLLRMIKIWIISSFIVSLYAMYLFLASLFKKPVFLLPGIQGIQYISINGLGYFIRNVTFKEGNIFGGYMLASLLITLPFIFIKDREVNPFSTKLIYVIFFFQLIALLISYSAINIITFTVIALIFFIITSFKKIGSSLRRKQIKLLSILLIITLLFVKFGLHNTLYEKLFGNDRVWSYSRKDRINMAVTGLKMTNKNLIFGVGPGNYGYYYNEFSADSFKDEKNKRIVGNIYIEMLCETGVLGLVIYLLFILLMIRVCFIKTKTIMGCYQPVVNGLFCAFIGMLLAYNAFPTFTLTFHWVLMGILLSSLRVLQTNRVDS